MKNELLALLQMKSVWILVQKDYRIDFRQKYPIMGIALYVISTIYISYLSFREAIDLQSWNSLFWIIILFSSNTAMAKGFSQEEDRSLYYYYLVNSQKILLSKFIYAVLYQSILLILVIGIYLILFGQILPLNFEFLLNTLAGGVGLACIFTMVSSLSSKTGNKAIMMAILGMPLALPVLLTAHSNSRALLLGATLADIQGNFLTMLSTIVIIIALSFILFPYSWKN